MSSVDVYQIYVFRRHLSGLRVGDVHLLLPTIGAIADHAGAGIKSHVGTIHRQVNDLATVGPIGVLDHNLGAAGASERNQAGSIPGESRVGFYLPWRGKLNQIVALDVGYPDLVVVGVDRESFRGKCVKAWQQAAGAAGNGTETGGIASLPLRIRKLC